MYHLTRYKYIFFAISLIIIVPGLLALIFWGLNLGIDFTNGTSIQMRFASNTVTQDSLKSYFQDTLKAQDVEVYTSVDQTDAPTGAQYVYITFSRPIDTDLQTEVKNRLLKLDPAGDGTTSTDVGAQVVATYPIVTYSGDKDSTALMVVTFDKDKTPKAADIETALQKLPDTTMPTSPVVTPTPTEAPTGTTTATTAANGPAAATATPVPATPTPTATATAEKFPVTVTKVTPGDSAQSFLINTQTPFDLDKLNQTTFDLVKAYGPGFVESNNTVGPSIASDTTKSAVAAVLVASVVICFYIAFAFRKVGTVRDSLRYGVSAIAALLHDVLVVLGLWAIFGHFFGFKVDSLFLTAILTVIGFSVHDTIVVFDRIRENMSRRTSESFTTVVDASLLQTMNRSLNTSLTVLFTLAALTLFGGESIREFTLALLIGIASGTFSSIFNASMILTVWETGEYKTWFNYWGGRFAPTQPAALNGRRRELVGTRR